MKPRITKVVGPLPGVLAQWRCAGSGMEGYGSTPSYAYHGWLTGIGARAREKHSNDRARLRGGL